MVQKDEILSVKNSIYLKMKESDKVYSIYNIKMEYYSKFSGEIKDDEILQSFYSDNRFIKINEEQFILKEIVDELIQNNLNNDIEDIEKSIKEKYFLYKINRDILIDMKSKYKNDSKLIIKYKNNKYEIRNKDEFYSVMLKEGRISFDAIKCTSEFLGIRIHEIMEELEDSNVLMSNDIKMECISNKNQINNELNKNNAYGICLEEETTNHYETDYLFVKNNVRQSLNENLLENKNLLLMDLRTNELIACLFTLSFFDKDYPIDDSHFSTKHINALRNMKIITIKINYKNITKGIATKYCYYTFTDIGYELVSLFKNSLSVNYDLNVIKTLEYECTTQELSKKNEIKKIDDNEKVWNDIKPALKKIYLNNSYIKEFINLLICANNSKCNNMADIFMYAIDNYDLLKTRELLVGNNATNGIKPIRYREDICYKCDERKCGLKNDKEIESILKNYRNEYVNKLIKKINKDENNLELIRNDLLTIKFIIPYNLCDRQKTFFIKLNFIKDSKILYKDSGCYCPFKDMWVIKNDLLV